MGCPSRDPAIRAVGTKGRGKEIDDVHFAPGEKVYLRILGTDRQLGATWLRL